MAQARILLVDDDFLIRLMLSEALEDAGFGVRQAEDGDEAAALVDTEERFDLMVTDIQMPGRLDGLRLGRRVREKHPALPIIYTTGRPDVMRDRSRLGPHDAFVAKPYGPADIIGIATRMLHRQAARAS